MYHLNIIIINKILEDKEIKYLKFIVVIVKDMTIDSLKNLEGFLKNENNY